ncbi:MAG: hypothetical protein NTX87_07500 [Planctomycetota bacterium]|nr:hypothetical protein [Planctomycetota bacterium]
MIRFNCTCGKRLKARPEDAGRMIVCPQCGAKMIAPGGAAPASAPEALAAAVRELTKPAAPDNGDGQADDIPVAEVVDEPPTAAGRFSSPVALRTAGPRSAGAKEPPLSPEAAAALAGLDALARAAPPKPAARPAAKSDTKKKPAAAQGRGTLASNGGPAGTSPLARNPMLIAIAAAVGIAVVLLVLSFFLGGGGVSKKRKEPAPEVVPPPPAAAKPAKPDWGDHPPGELFPNVKPQN